jgi:hypothetical protein
MAKKRYDEGGDVESTNKSVREAIAKPEMDDSSASGQYSSPKSQALSESSGSFGDAFKAARSAGDKTFTWGGKSYTTDIAAPKKAAAPAPAPAKASTPIGMRGRIDTSGLDKNTLLPARKMKTGGAVKSRGDGIAQRGHTKGRHL